MKDILPQKETGFIEAGFAAEGEFNAVFQFLLGAACGCGKQDLEHQAPLPQSAQGDTRVRVVAAVFLGRLHCLSPEFRTRDEDEFITTSNKKRKQRCSFWRMSVVFDQDGAGIRKKINGRGPLL